MIHCDARLDLTSIGTGADQAWIDHTTSRCGSAAVAVAIPGGVYAAAVPTYGHHSASRSALDAVLAFVGAARRGCDRCSVGGRSSRAETRSRRHPARGHAQMADLVRRSTVQRGPRPLTRVYAYLARRRSTPVATPNIGVRECSYPLRRCSRHTGAATICAHWRSRARPRPRARGAMLPRPLAVSSPSRATSPRRRDTIPQRRVSLDSARDALRSCSTRPLTTPSRRARERSSEYERWSDRVRIRRRRRMGRRGRRRALVVRLRLVGEAAPLTGASLVLHTRTA